MNGITILRANKQAKVATTSGFNTLAPEVIRSSEPTIILVLKYFEGTHTIQAQCADGHFRECRILKLDSDAAVSKVKARELWKALKKATLEEQPVTFFSSGINFWPDRWFFKIAG